MKFLDGMNPVAATLSKFIPHQRRGEGGPDGTVELTINLSPEITKSLPRALATAAGQIPIGTLDLNDFTIESRNVTIGLTPALIQSIRVDAVTLTNFQLVHEKKGTGDDITISFRFKLSLDPMSSGWCCMNHGSSVWLQCEEGQRSLPGTEKE